MNPAGAIAHSELILGGQKSGKSRRAEQLARQWLAESNAHRAVLIATGQAWDAEMAARIERHQKERAERVPGLLTVEEPRDLAGALARVSSPQALVVVDCLTLWLTNWLMPAPSVGDAGDRAGPHPRPLPGGEGVIPAQPIALAPLGRGRGEGLLPSEIEKKSAKMQCWPTQSALFFEALQTAPGPVVLVGNEIGLGVIPLGREVRAFVDALGCLNQQAAQACTRVTLMVAGLPMTVKAA
ncbi:MAG: bifunctional adenosylcobinamide kinase/adenosylcobinamide-phosphate guanylyltransferase [Proteobacteria bacterium]|nr:bifunctional adenosylcobinamide kinase/adenosylcobinamide-phosphate guanylyltransferase [Pseudomonadota bacterium]